MKTDYLFDHEFDPKLTATVVFERVGKVEGE